MQDSENTILRKHLVEIARDCDGFKSRITEMNAKQEEYERGMEARCLEYERVISGLRLELAAARDEAGSAAAPKGGKKAGKKGRRTACGCNCQCGKKGGKKGLVKALSDKVKDLEGLLENAARKLAFYDSHNNPSARDYNDKRKEFRKKHGTYDKDAGTRKIGPPVGHKGISHNRKAEEKIRYNLHACTECGRSDRLRRERPQVKLFVEAGKDISITAERAWCGHCEMIVVAPSPSIKGTHMGPGMLGMVAEYAAEHSTDRSTSRYLERLHGVKASPNMVRSARLALAVLLWATMVRVRDYIIENATYVHRDETPIRIGGKWGYVWLVCWGSAVFVIVVGSRSREVMSVYFAGMHDIPSVTDEYSAYMHLPVRQSCWIHILRRAESIAVRSGKKSDLMAYLMLRGIYRTIKEMDTAGPEVISELEAQVLAVADMYGEGHEMHTALHNALSTLFTFLKHPDMPPHNNRAEQEIHAGPAKEKRIRRQLKNYKGMRCMSVFSTVFRTAENLGVWPSEAVRMAARDPNWDIFAHASGPGPPLDRQARRPESLSGAAA